MFAFNLVSLPRKNRTNMHLKKTLPLLIAIIAMPFIMMGQVTTSSIAGIVKNSAGNVLPGATVTATHVPTGTVYSTSSRAGGRFEINNMNPGGPYTVSISFVGFDTDTKQDIYLSLGETRNLDVNLGEKSTQLSEVVVATRRNANLRTGAETTIGRDRMENLPTVGRNIADYLRATPQMKLSGSGNASGENGMSFAGQNVRYNSFYIDGAVNNDQFGLAYSGTNGGQSSISPISIDAIDQFQVSISPYNASLGNFTGAAINAITKSGTNDLHGSAYYIFRNQNLSGKTPTGPKELATKLSEFSNRTIGLTLGGPIVKNKIFFFVSAEMQRDETPNPFDLASYQGNTKDVNVINTLIDSIRRKGHGYDPGGYLNNVGEVKSDKVTAKIDWNLNNRHKLALSYRYTGGDRVVVFTGNPTTINFYKGGYRFPTKTNSASAELKSTFGKSSNRLLLTFTDVEDDRGPIDGGDPFPNVQIFDGPTSSIRFGTEANSTFNYLKQTTYNLVDQFKFNIGKNSIMVGAEGEYYKAYNSFISNTAGTYVYDSLQAFLRELKPNSYIANFALLGSKDEKNSDAAAQFDIFKGGIFINDEIRANKNLTLTFGVRADYYKFITDPIADKFAIDSALPKFGQYYDLKGALPGVQPKVPVELSPRFGFTLNLPDENLTIRGGAGWFAGRIPMVWPGAMYNSNGLAIGGYRLNSSTNTAIWNQDKVRFRTNPYTPEELGISLNNAKGTLVLTAHKFRMPKVFRTSVAFDKRFGQGWTATTEFMYTKNINDIYYQNINLLPPTLKMATGPDTRGVYASPATIPIRSNNTNPYTDAYLISNATGQKPFSYNFTFMVSKSSRKGVNGSVSYNYGESQVINEAQSSTPGSQWNSMETINGRNYLQLSNSDNSVGHRIFAYVSKKFSYANDHLSTSISLTYTGQSGQPFSYAYSGQAVRDGISNLDLIYIPTETELQAQTFQPLTVSGVTYTDVQQKAAFNSFIEKDKYLRTHRGKYAERNGSRTPFTHIIDLRIAQGFNLKLGGKTYSAEIAYAMFNFTNFLNRDWGRQYFVNNDTYTPIAISYTTPTNLTPRYTFNPNTASPFVVYNRFTPSYTARWLSQLEFRIRF
jgi:outer membrane receptor for ferrienterochelin and colicin